MQRPCALHLRQCDVVELARQAVRAATQAESDSRVTSGPSPPGIVGGRPCEAGWPRPREFQVKA